MPYALSNPQDGKEPPFRAISAPANAAPGEIPVDEEPQGKVWDATNRRLRSKTEAEKKAERDAESSEARADADDLALLKNSLLPEARALFRILHRRGLA